MLYRTPLAVPAALYSLSSASTDVQENALKISPGIYQIENPATGTWARNHPGGGHQGPWRTSIWMSSGFPNSYQLWEITHHEEGYKIRNTGSRGSAFSTGHADDSVLGYSDGFTKWYIEPMGGSDYRIHYPNKDLIWTIAKNEFFTDAISLQPAQGTEDQIFRLVKGSDNWD